MSRLDANLMPAAVKHDAYRVYSADKNHGAGKTSSITGSWIYIGRFGYIRGQVFAIGHPGLQKRHSVGD
ncbi:hypothetical protein PHLCEN_2v2437 [Hermanssonia centrifuga]|uniref:Uncharacterized protein n=1 Tax=Hermanssonia centrifuga TaxID=98765 RepID=A0A2R6RLW7_9APHY|nr:hypothetical protein PHLCEN_2v2437 [Hermanssonia centrifuga]